MSAPLVLWDLDGTLLSCGSVTQQVFDQVLRSLVGEYVLSADPREYNGLTDPMIAAKILLDLDADPSLAPRLLEAYAAEMGSRHEQVRAEGTVLPHARESLHAVAERGIQQGVVTGNIRAIARLKVGALGLDAHLDLDAAAFGDDGPTRDDLVPIALARAGHPDPRAVWVVGDTPRDLACARVAGVRCLLVATGGHDVAELSALGADAVLPDLSGALDVLLG